MGGRDAHDRHACVPRVLLEVLEEGRGDVPPAVVRVDDELRDPPHGVWRIAPLRRVCRTGMGGWTDLGRIATSWRTRARRAYRARCTERGSRPRGY